MRGEPGTEARLHEYTEAVHSVHLIDFRKWIYVHVYRQGLWLISLVVNSIISTYVIQNYDPMN